MRSEGRVRTIVAAGLVAASAFLGSGCATESAAFRPTDVRARVPPDYPAAYYRVVQRGHDEGNVKVWSEGAYAQTEGGRYVVDVRLRIRNDADGPIRFDLAGTDCELATGAKDTTVLSEPSSVTGPETVSPGGLARITLRYTLPAGVAPDQLLGFELNWRLETPKGPFSQSTSFVRKERADGYAYWPYDTHWWPYSYGYSYDYPYGYWYGGPWLGDEGDEGDED